MRTRKHRRARRDLSDPWHLDLGHLTDGRKRASVLCIVDSFSRTLLAFDIQETFTGQDVVQALDHVTGVHGAPCALIADEGALFKNEAIVRWAVQHSTQIIHPSVHVPSVKGLFERLFPSAVANLYVPNKRQT